MVSPTFRRELKGVVRVAVVEAGGQEACAAVSSRIRRHAAFSDYANPEIEDRHLPIDVAIEIDHHNRNGRIVGAMARMLGFLLVRVPDVSGAGLGLGRTIARAMKETAEVFATLADALDDRLISPSELVALEDQIDRAQAKLEMLRLHARAEVHGAEGE